MIRAQFKVCVRDICRVCFKQKVRAVSKICFWRCTRYNTITVERNDLAASIRTVDRTRCVLQNVLLFTDRTGVVHVDVWTVEEPGATESNRVVNSRPVVSESGRHHSQNHENTEYHQEPHRRKVGLVAKPQPHNRLVVLYQHRLLQISSSHLIIVIQVVLV